MSISDFTSPIWFLFFAVVAAIVIGYLVVQRQRHKHMLRFSNMELLEKVAPTRPSPLRHVPIILMVVGLLCLTIAAAGPTALKKEPRNRATVMLVMDVSLSMEATDVPPSRLEVAQEAAKDFADGLTPGVNLGLVSFAGTAAVLSTPSTNREATKAAIDGIKLSQRTATGEGILAAIQSIETLGAVLGGAEEPPPARIILMSDGKQTVPHERETSDPRHGFTAARLAKSKGIPISSISFGTDWGSVEIEDPDGSGQRDSVPVPVANDSLREVAKLSGGEFYTASSLEELSAVYDTLEEQIGFELTRGDASRPWMLLGMVVTAAGLVTAILYRQRLP